jgi:tetratricopeptide (TPR) repeat protein
MQVDNPSAWGSTLAAAWTALEHARTLLRQEPDLAATVLAQQAQHTQAQLEADAKDCQLLAVYDQVRLEQSQWDLQRRRFKLAESYPRLQQALAEYGLALGGLAAGEAAARLRQRPEAIQPHLRAVLWECLAWAPQEQGAQRRWLAAVLAVDADPWLKQFRQAVEKKEWPDLEKLAGQAEVGHYPPAVLIGLARNLPPAARASQLLLLRRAQQQYPGDFWANLVLGTALYHSVFPSKTNRPPGAEELAVVYEAVAFYRVAVGLRPGNAPAHSSLGNALKAQGDLKGAIACYTKALKLDPKDATAHTNLGNALAEQGDLKGAIAYYTKALKLDPKDATVHYNLGKALQAQKDLKGAIACYRKALKLDPTFAEAHCNLGQALREQGDFAQALQALQRGHQLGSRRADWPYPSARWVEDCRRLLALEPRLPALLQGDDQPKDTAEQLTLAELCEFKKRYAAAAHFYQGAFAAEPKPTPKEQARHCYDAACCAALAAEGKGEDAATLLDQEKARLRKQALAWLNDALTIHRHQLAEEDNQGRTLVRWTLQHWQKDHDLDSVRGKEALAKLPEAERAAWQQLWAEVEALLKKTQQSPK